MTDMADRELLELAACPFCGQSKTTELVDSNDFRERQPWEGEDEGYPIYWAVMCDASKPGGKGGCGASSGFMPTEAEAAQKWNMRAAAAIGKEMP